MRPRRQSLGQHFLHDQGMVRKIIAASEIQENEQVVEIGPGPGSLTRALAGTRARITAIEVDKSLFDQLQTELNPARAPSPVQLVHADALEFPFDTLPSPFVVIGNLPYSISTPLLFRLLKYRQCIDRMIIMVQKEVARRMVARPGTKDYGPLSIGIQYYTEPRIAFSVPPGCFKPPPR
ncbi:MAG TPA: 16S rRNA (adenine(1518)-N(6)/adenine(1519)-N(6))-dimethyltransferase RsmA, partial [Nitrospiria bacterium]|nr:16S rRNA (adenine(1518)-N(6)/adenine(1519)-N(6))-dimethyltransferase RsmA [Nitrospiria bacterium]